MKKFILAVFAMAFALCFRFSVANAEAQITFEDVTLILNRGNPILSGYLVNPGNTDVQITRFVIQKIRAVNSNDYWIWSAKDVNFYPENLIVPAGERVYHSFRFNDADAPERGQVKSKFLYVVYKKELTTPVKPDAEESEDEHEKNFEDEKI